MTEIYIGLKFFQTILPVPAVNSVCGDGGIERSIKIYICY